MTLLTSTRLSEPLPRMSLRIGARSPSAAPPPAAPTSSRSPRSGRNSRPRRRHRALGFRCSVTGCLAPGIEKELLLVQELLAQLLLVVLPQRRLRRAGDAPVASQLVDAHAERVGRAVTAGVELGVGREDQGDLPSAAAPASPLRPPALPPPKIPHPATARAMLKLSNHTHRLERRPGFPIAFISPPRLDDLRRPQTAARTHEPFGLRAARSPYPSRNPSR